MRNESVEVTSHCMLRGNRRPSAWLWLIVVSLVGGVVYLPTFVSLAVSYTGPHSYYAHWFLIPPVSAFFVWLKKERIRRLPPPRAGCGWGLTLAAGSLLMHVFAVWFRIDFVSAFSLVVTVLGLALYLFGKRIVREIRFPLLFLFFMVPLPELVVSPFAFHMKILSGKLAVFFYNQLGGNAILSGSSIIFAEGEPLWMGYECSGLRSLIALAALGAAFAHLVDASLPRKVLLFVVSLPLAVLSNGLRVTSLCFAANRWGVNTKAFKGFHDVSSPVVFIIVLVGLFAAHRLLSIGRGRKKIESEGPSAGKEASGSEAVTRAVPRRRLATAFGLFASSAVLVYLSPHSLTLTQWMSLLKPVELPEHIGAWQKTSTELVGSEGVWAMLNTKSIISSTYRDAEGREIEVLVVASDTHRDAFHPPEVCMVGAGSEVVRSWKEPITIGSAASKRLYLNAFILRGSEHSDKLVLYWFMAGKTSIGSRLLQQLILLLNGVRKTPITGSMIRVMAPLTTMSREEALLSAKDLIRLLVPIMPGLLETAKKSGAP